MFFSKLIHFHCFQWKLQVPSFSRLGLYSMKNLACANLRMLQKEDHARDKSSPLFCPPHHTASCHRVSSPSEKGYTAVFQGGVLSCSWAARNLEQPLEHEQLLMVHSPPAGRSRAGILHHCEVATTGPFQKRNSEPQQTSHTYS